MANRPQASDLFKIPKGGPPLGVARQRQQILHGIYQRGDRGPNWWPCYSCKYWLQSHRMAWRSQADYENAQQYGSAARNALYREEHKCMHCWLVEDAEPTDVVRVAPDTFPYRVHSTNLDDYFCGVCGRFDCLCLTCRRGIECSARPMTCPGVNNAGAVGGGIHNMQSFKLVSQYARGYEGILHTPGTWMPGAVTMLGNRWALRIAAGGPANRGMRLRGRRGGVLASRRNPMGRRVVDGRLFGRGFGWR